MNVKRLTAAEHARVQFLALRMLHIQKQAQSLRNVPLTDPHPATGMPTWMMLAAMAGCAELTDRDLSEVLT